MNKIIICFLLLILPYTVFCNTSSDSTKPEKAQIGFVISPDYCFRALKADGDAQWMANIRDTMEIPKFGYSAGLNFAHTLGPKFLFEAEILFTNKGEATKKYNIENVPQQEIKTVMKTSYLKNYYYLDIPLKVNYFFLSKNNLRLFVTVGLSVNTYLGQSTFVTEQYNDGSQRGYVSKAQLNYEKVNLAMLAGIGLNYDLTDRYVFKLEPIYKRSINSIIDAPVKSYLYSVGLNVGISYRF